MIDYYQIQSDIKTIISGGTYTDPIKEVFIEAMDRDMLLGNMPCINIRLVNANIQVRSLPNGYYAFVAFEIDVLSFDLSLFEKAAIVRDRIMRQVQLRLQANRQFSAGVETSTVGPRVIFSAGTADDNENTRGHIALATFDFVVEAFVEPA